MFVFNRDTHTRVEYCIDIEEVIQLSYEEVRAMHFGHAFFEIQQITESFHSSCIRFFSTTLLCRRPFNPWNALQNAQKK